MGCYYLKVKDRSLFQSSLGWGENYVNYVKEEKLVIL